MIFVKTLCVIAAVGCLSVAAVPRPDSASQQGVADRQFRGLVTEVWVSAPGQVQFRMQGTDDKGKQASVWFNTPRDKDVNTLLENLALSLIRHSLESGTDLIVESKDSSGDDGSIATKGYSVVRMGVRPKAAEGPR